MNLQIEGEHPILKGEIQIIDSNGKFWGTYQIEIHDRLEFPARFPNVFETAEELPRIADWHIYPNSGTCCVAVLPVELIACKKGITLLSFIDEFVMPYFFNQTFRKNFGYYPAGEYSHDLQGIIEFYLEQLKTTSIKDALKWLHRISEGGEPSRTSFCFCGKKVKYRHCHRDAFRSISLIGKQELHKHIFTIAMKLGLGFPAKNF